MNREEIKTQLRDFLFAREDIVFAYLHGSFLHKKDFRDVDTAVFLSEKPGRPADPLEYEMSLSLELEKRLRLPVDIKIFNDAPVSFRYHVSRGRLLFSKDESVRENALCRTWSEYFDFLPLTRVYMEEVARA